MTHSQNINLKKLMHESKGKHGHSIFDQITNLLSFIDNNPKYGDLNEIESLSYFLTSTKFQYQKYETAQEVNNKKAHDEFGLKAYNNRLSGLINGKAKIAPDSFVQNFSDINNDWNTAGYGFSETEASIIHASLEKLAADNKAEKIAFLGIVKGTVKDYFVAYGRLSSYPNDLLPENWEKQGVGVNGVTFWVLGQWTELPAIGPDHINVSRLVKHALTGNLESDVVTLPPFQGKEKHFLKAQLTRILFNCEIAPTGCFKTVEEKETEIEQDKEYTIQGKDELSAFETWVHVNPYILKQGRITHYIPKNLKAEDAEELKSKLEEKDPNIERLKGIGEDKPVAPVETAPYLVRSYGDKQVFTMVDKDEGNSCSYEVFVIQSLQWPGFYTIINPAKQRWSHLYIGLATKANQPFIPKKLADFLGEPSDLKEHAEKPKIDDPNDPNNPDVNPDEPQDD